MVNEERRTTIGWFALPAALWSALLVAFGGWWWLRPDTYPFPRDEGAGTLLGLLPAEMATPVLAGAGAVGILVALLATARGAGTMVGTVAAAHAIGFGLLAPGLQPLVAAGYLMAICGPLVLFVVVVAGAWRWRGGPVAVGVLLALAALAWITGFADGDVLRGYAAVIAGFGPKLVVPLILTFFLAGGLLWGALGAAVYLRGRAGRPAPGWTRPESAARWGKVATLVAAACALPYGLHRLTWLTPWPIGMSAEAFIAYPEMRLHGFLLGMAALAGAVLTTGLISRWGEVWPRWLPVVRGRSVPIAAAVVPGTVVAALFTVAAPSIVQMSIEQGELWGVLVFPFPVWGPALCVAVLAYYLRRRSVAVPAGTIEGS